MHSVRLPRFMGPPPTVRRLSSDSERWSLRPSRTRRAGDRIIECSIMNAMAPEGNSSAIRRMRALRMCVAAGLFAGVALSYRLWLSSRLYPLTPAWPFPKPLPPPFDSARLVVLLGLALAIAFSRRPRVFIGVYVALAVWAAWEDQSRWQPWFYQYVFMLAAIGLAAVYKPDGALNTCRLVVASIYVWSGLEKLNPNFVHNTIPFLLTPLHLLALKKVMIAAPLLECAAGFALLSRRFRRPAVVCAAGMHIFIILTIGPFGWNYNAVVWPWNFAMIAFLIILFWGADDSPHDILRVQAPWPEFAFQKVVLVLFGLAPALSFFNLWDTYLSFAFYTGNGDSASIYLNDATFARLPDELADYVYENSPDVNELSIPDWSWGEFNVPHYPENRIYRNVFRRVCELTGSPSDLRLVVRGKLALLHSRRVRVYHCARAAQSTAYAGQNRAPAPAR